MKYKFKTYDDLLADPEYKRLYRELKKLEKVNIVDDEHWEVVKKEIEKVEKAREKLEDQCEELQNL